MKEDEKECVVSSPSVCCRLRKKEWKSRIE
jgi:hypothetical protein